jgi:phospho-N-acetylmuramoyl-pentapeptide-transferase
LGGAVIYLLSYFVKLPAVWTYTSTRMILGALTGFLFSIVLGPTFIKWLYEMKIGQSIRKEECPHLGMLHAKKENTPTMGGMLIIVSMLLALLLWMDPKSSFTLLLLFVTLTVAFIGGTDDYLKIKKKNAKGLSAKRKFRAQLAIAGLFSLYLYVPGVAEFFHWGSWFTPPYAKDHEGVLSLTDYMKDLFVPFFKNPVLVMPAIVGVVLSMVVITGSSNAVNLTDGLDGLAGGSLIMVATALSGIAFLSNNTDIASYLNILYIDGSGEIAVYLAALAGACLGFLWYNGHPAQVFMGDIGSLTLGAVIGASAVLLRRELLLAIIGGIFVAEALSVILQVGSYKLRDKKRIFLCAPLHHHFEYKGWHETKVVVRFWIVGLLLAMVGIGSLKFQ